MKKTTRKFNLMLPGIITFAAAASIGLAACGSSDNSSETTAESTTTSVAETTTASTTASTTAATTASSTADTGVFPDVAGADGTKYTELFTVICDDQYDDYWTEKCAEYIGEEQAAAAADMLKASITSTIYGQEAIDTIEKNPEAFAFDCFFINDADGFEFKDDQMTVTLADGTENTYTYEYVGKVNIGDGETFEFQGEEMNPSMECDAYKSTEDAGEFTYLLLAPDTMDTTYHIEFRYGSDLDELKGYFTGKYAYWLAAGIDENADEDTIHNVIDLFVEENLAGEE